jgi:hypothetical protein
MPERTLSNYINNGRRGGKTSKTDDKAVEALKEYITGISKRDRDRIQWELEQEEYKTAVTKNLFNSADVNFDPSVPQVRYYHSGNWASNWAAESNPQAEQIAEEVSDVSFED